MSEKFSLKWNDFHSNVSKSFEVLRNEEHLQDVTLVGDDDFQVKAHKLVLSACSSYFKRIFAKNIQSNILFLLCLEGTTQKDLHNILDYMYMYHGEVKIFQEELDRFLTIAQRMKLEGLMGDTNDPQSDQNESELINSYDDQESSAPKETKRTYTRDLSAFEDKMTIEMSSEDMNEINVKVQENFEKVSSGVFKCRLCNKVCKQSIDMKRHVETHLEGLSYPCQQCGKTYRSKDVLRHHLRKHK